MSRLAISAALVSAAFLASCGGGGGYGASMPSPPMNLSSAPGETAMVSYLQVSHEYMLNEQGSGMYSVQFSSVPNNGTTMFDGMGPAYSIVETVSVDAHGMAIGSGTTTIYFLLNPYVPLGEVSSVGTPYGVVTSSNPFPATLNVGDSGTLDTESLFHDATMATVDATLTVTYSVMANDASTLLFCLDSTTSAVTAQGTTDGLADGSESNCYSVDAAGNVTLDSITVTIGGTPIKFVAG